MKTVRLPISFISNKDTKVLSKLLNNYSVEILSKEF